MKPKQIDDIILELLDLTPDEEGDCFRRAYEIATRLQVLVDEYGLALNDVRLCHGAPVGVGGDAAGVRYAHAWVELSALGGDPAVIDFSSGLRVKARRVQYYRKGRIEPAKVVRYTGDEAERMVREHLHYGPWHADAGVLRTPDMMGWEASDA